MIFARFFEVKPFNQGYLPTADGHDVYFMEFGNPKGKPVLMTHGGPGGCCKGKYAKKFDLKKYRVIMFDQRGCGQSLPLGEMKNNSAEDTIFDMKRLLEYLNINEKIILKGGSWGSTIALLFAERNPKLLDKMLLSQIFLADEANEEWMLKQSALFYPDVVDKFNAEVKGWGSVPSYYAKLINSDDKEAQLKAANLLGQYERVLGGFDVEVKIQELDDRSLNDMRIYLNYWAKHYTLKSNEIMRNVKKIAHIRTLIVHNRLDFSCPLQAAYELHKAMPKSKLVIVPEKGHVGKLLYETIDKESREFLNNS